MAAVPRAHVPGQEARTWTEDDIALFSGFLVTNKWTLRDGAAMRACLLFTPPRPMEQMYSMCKMLKNRTSDRWSKYWMPVGEVHRGRKGKLLDSLPTHDTEGSNVLRPTLGGRAWTTPQLDVVTEFYEATQAGSSVSTMRETVNANPGAGLCVKQVCLQGMSGVVSIQAAAMQSMQD